MKKLKSSLANMVVVLVVVALVTGGLLAWVNQITVGPIAKQAEQTLADGIKTVMGAKDLKVDSNDTVKINRDGKESIYIVHATSQGGKPLGAAVESTTQGFGGDLKVLVGFNPEGAILGYTILQTAETPGLGQKADKWFQKGGKGDIIGKNAADKPLTVKKDGGEVDAITASTITSRAFLLAVNQAYEAYKQQAADGKTGASPKHHEQ